AREQQVRFEARVRRLLDDLVREVARLLLETPRRDLRETEQRGRVVLVEHEALLEELRGLVVLMRREEQVAPARAQPRVLRVLLDRLLEQGVRHAHVAARARRVGLEAQIVALREQRDEALLRLGARATIRRAVARDEIRLAVERVFDRDPERALRGAERANRAQNERQALRHALLLLRLLRFLRVVDLALHVGELD